MKWIVNPAKKWMRIRHNQQEIQSSERNIRKQINGFSTKQKQNQYYLLRLAKA